MYIAIETYIEVQECHRNLTSVYMCIFNLLKFSALSKPPGYVGTLQYTSEHISIEISFTYMYMYIKFRGGACLGRWAHV